MAFAPFILSAFAAGFALSSLSHDLRRLPVIARELRAALELLDCRN